MRKDESRRVVEALTPLGLGDHLTFVDASDTFLAALDGRRGARAQAAHHRRHVHRRSSTARRGASVSSDTCSRKGTIYPDTIETGGTKRADTIKTHHNRVPDHPGDDRAGAGRGAARGALQGGGAGTRRASRRSARDDLAASVPGAGTRRAPALLDRRGGPRPLRRASSRGSREVAGTRGMLATVLPIRSVGVKADLRSYEHPVLLTGEAAWAGSAARRRHDLQGRCRTSTGASGGSAGAAPTRFRPLAATMTRARLDLLREADALRDGRAATPRPLRLDLAVPHRPGAARGGRRGPRVRHRPADPLGTGHDRDAGSNCRRPARRACGRSCSRCPACPDSRSTSPRSRRARSSGNSVIRAAPGLCPRGTARAPSRPLRLTLRGTDEPSVDWSRRTSQRRRRPRRAHAARSPSTGSSAIIAVAICFVPALFFGKRAGKSTSEFFASGRSVPWWLAGLSMVATTFSSDTPNLVTDIVRRNGVAGNWVWWAFVLTGVATVFFYARLWRRSGVLTDLEFYEIAVLGQGGEPSSAGSARSTWGCSSTASSWRRSTWPPARSPRSCSACERWQTLTFVGLLNVAFAAHSGLWGVLVIDMIQFFIKMTAVIAAAYFALQAPQVGGLTGLVDKLSTMRGPGRGRLPDHAARLHQQLGSGGGRLHHADRRAVVGGLVSRARSPAAAATSRSACWRRSPRRTRWAPCCSSTSRTTCCGRGRGFSSAWLAARLPGAVGHPEGVSGARPEPARPRHRLSGDAEVPAGRLRRPDGGRADRGELVDDPDAPELGRVVPRPRLLPAVHQEGRDREALRDGGPPGDASVCSWARPGMVYLLDTAKDAFDIILQVGAGTGLLYLVRWFWWRVNAWCEVVAMVSSFVVSLGLLVAARVGIAGQHAQGAAAHRGRDHGVLGGDRATSARRPTATC